MLPIGGVCLAGIGGAGGLDITAGLIGEALKVRRQGRGVVCRQHSGTIGSGWSCTVGHDHAAPTSV